MKITKQTSWQIQKSVIFALLMREMRSRFGRFKLGYFWAILEPVSAIAALSGIRILMGSGDIEGLPFPIFFASGIFIYRLFTSLGISAIGQVESNLNLLNYQRIQPADAIVARALLEVLINSISLAFVLGAFYYFGFKFEWDFTLGFLAVYGCMIMFSVGVGFIFATISPYFGEFKKIAPIVLQPLFFVSGIFFSVNGFPESGLPFILWNPILHGIELSRSMMFFSYDAQHVSIFYLFICAVSSLFIGLSVFRINRRRIVTSGTVKLT